MNLSSLRNRTQLMLLFVDEGEIWVPPIQGNWKLNCDGSVNNNGRSAGCDGVLRDFRGRFVFAFASRLDPCSVLEAELNAILHVIRIAWSKGFCRQEVEADSAEVVELLMNRSSGNGKLQRLVRDIIEVGDDTLIIAWKEGGKTG